MVATNRPLQASGSMDYEGLMKTIKYLLDASWGKSWGLFTASGPNTTDPRSVDYPIVIHSLEHLVPGVIGKTTREVKPRHRYFGINEDVNGTAPPAVSVYGQVFDAEISFEIWEETNEKADKLARKLRQLLATFSGYLKEKGLKEILFMKMEKKTSNLGMRDDHKVRVLTYFVKFEELHEVPIDLFKVIEVVERKLQEQD